MKIFKIIVVTLFLIAIPMVLLNVFVFATEEVEMEMCMDRRRPCRGENCRDMPCRNTEIKTVRVERKYKDVVKQHPLMLFIPIVYLASLICYLIAVRKNSYSYIGFDDLGLMGIIAICVYAANALFSAFVPMMVYAQTGVGPLFVMMSMAFVPFILRPIFVDI